MTPCPYCDGSRDLAGGPCVCAPWSRVEHIAPGVTLYLGDSLEVLPALAGRHDVASVVTDPPYGLGEHPDPMELLRCWTDGRPYAAKGAGFMGKEWDAFVPGPEIWRPVMDLLPPGGHMLAAFGTRTYDLGTLAVRLAGAEVRDCVAWLYGSGFPKSLDVSKAIDKAAGAERTEVIGKSARHGGGVPGAGTSYEVNPAVPMLYAPATDAARQWEGWGTALKPAMEPWVLARKPLDGTVARNVLTHGVGALHIDACRVGFADDADRAESTGKNQHETFGSGARGQATVYGSMDRPRDNYAPVGRWPANVIHDGSDEVLAGFPVTTSGTRNGERKEHNEFGTFADRARDSGYFREGDTGSAARFFACFPPDDASRFMYCAKASKRDRDEGMAGADDAVLARSNLAATREHAGDTVTSEGGGFNAARIVKNNHPTVKPEALMAYLCRLITPPRGTVLDPFMGSGSTGKAAVRAGFGFVGIERDPAYFDIAVRRVRAALEDAT